MGARQKLNAAYVYGCLIISGFVGLITQSWALFWVALVVTVAICSHSGGIRHRTHARHMRRGRSG